MGLPAPLPSASKGSSNFLGANLAVQDPQQLPSRAPTARLWCEVQANHTSGELVDWQVCEVCVRPRAARGPRGQHGGAAAHCPLQLLSVTSGSARRKTHRAPLPPPQLQCRSALASAPNPALVPRAAQPPAQLLVLPCCSGSGSNAPASLCLPLVPGSATGSGCSRAGWGSWWCRDRSSSGIGSWKSAAR